MIKSIFTEIIIILLLFIITLLLLGILFYDYMPNSKTIPAKVQEYALDETVKTELEKELSNNKPEEVVKTYKLDEYDVENFEKTNEYNKGKVNPFVEYSKGIDENNNSNNINTNTSTGGGTFLNTVGK